MTSVEQILSALVTPLEYLASPDKWVFWPWLLTATLLALWVYKKSKSPSRSFLKYLFGRNVWLSKSAFLDYQMSVTNGVIKVFFNASALLPMAAVAALFSTILDWTVTAPDLNLSRTVTTTSYTAALFIFGDLSRYLLHRLMHAVPALWNFHQIHHSATVLNPFTVYRVHPFESLLFGLRRSLSTGLVTGIFIWLFGTALNGYDILGVNAIGLVFNAFGSNLRHSHVWLSYGTALENIFLSPAQHQIHHSVKAEHYNKNFGTYLSLWDKLGRSWLEAGSEKNLEFGLGPSSPTPSHGLLSALWAPFAQLLKTR